MSRHGDQPDPYETGELNDAREGTEHGAERESADVLRRWETAEPSERLWQLDRVGRAMTRHGGPPAPGILTYEGDPSSRGQYNGEFIRLNADALADSDPRRALEAYLHEYRHVEQEQTEQMDRGSLRDIGDPERAALIRGSPEERYHEAPTDADASDYNERFDAYERQYREADARQWSNDRTNEILQRLKAEKALAEAYASGSFSDGDRAADRFLTRKD